MIIYNIKCYLPCCKLLIIYYRFKNKSGLGEKIDKNFYNPDFHLQMRLLLGLAQCDLRFWEGVVKVPGSLKKSQREK